MVARATDHVTSNHGVASNYSRRWLVRPFELDTNERAFATVSHFHILFDCPDRHTHTHTGIIRPFVIRG